MSIRRLYNPVQKYAWGSYTAIPELLGLPSPSDEPCAELWLGAHPRSPSMVYDADGWRPLNELIAERPEEILGQAAAIRFSQSLPFLFKVLAAEKPLSIQAHPDKQQAEDGFARENLAGIALDAPNRNYKDANHKPECLCALTPFPALCGFRTIPQILSNLSVIQSAALDQAGQRLTASPDAAGLSMFFETLLMLPQGHAATLVSEVVARAEHLVEEDDAFDWMVRLHQEYPGEGVVFFH